MRTHIRWCIRRDMPQVLAIEAASHPEPWEEEDFLQSLRRRNVIGMVAEDGDEVTGFMVYELHKGHLTVLRLATKPCRRRLGIGRTMVQRLCDKLHSHHRTRIRFDVDERQLDGHLFLKACGFQATSCDHAAGTYRFVWRLAAVAASQEGPPW